MFFQQPQELGGGEKWHYDMATRLAQNGYSVLVVSSRGSDLSRKISRSEILGHNITIGNGSFLNPFKIWRLVRLFKKEHVSKVILNLPADLKAAGIAARLAGVDKIIYRRGSAIPVRNSFLNRFLFRQVLSDVVANSEVTKQTILKNNRDLIQSERIHVVYNGIDLKAWDQQPTVDLSFRRNHEIVLGHAGRLCRQKNQKFLIETAKELKKKDIPFRLVIAGDGEMKREIKAHARDLGVDEEVEFLGFFEDMKSFMSNIDIFLLSSIWEGFGYVLVEAMACQKPVVAFESSSTPEIVANGVSGYLSAPQDLNSYVGAIEKIAINKDLRKKLGAAGRKLVEERFEVAKNLEDLEIVLGLPGRTAK